MALVSVISNFTHSIDVLGAELGADSATMAKFDGAMGTLEGVADKENPVVVISSMIIAGYVVARMGTEALAAGVITTVGEEAYVGVSAYIDGLISTNIPALFSVTSGTEIVGTAAASVGGIVAGEAIGQVADGVINSLINLLSSPNAVTLTTEPSSTINTPTNDTAYIKQDYSASGGLLDTRITGTDLAGDTTQTIGSTAPNGTPISITDSGTYGALPTVTGVSLDNNNYTAGNGISYQNFMNNTATTADNATEAAQVSQVGSALATYATDIVNNAVGALPASLQAALAPLTVDYSTDAADTSADDADLGDDEDILDYYAATAYNAPPVYTTDPTASQDGTSYWSDPDAGDGGGDGGDDEGDPIVISINRGTINLTAFTQSGVTFDFGGYSAKTSTGWTGANTGFLVLANASSTINGNSFLTLPQLATLDANRDGVINASDSAFANLAVWVDKNNDGVYESGELITLASLGITSISVASTPSSATIVGNVVTATGKVTYSNGATGVIDDVTFGTPSHALAINGESASALTYLQRVLKDNPAAAEGAAQADVAALNKYLNTLATPDSVVVHDEALSKPIFAGNMLSGSQIYTITMNQIYFDGNTNGTGSADPANKLWVTNGTAAGTLQVTGSKPAGVYVNLGTIIPQSWTGYTNFISNQIALGTTGKSLFINLFDPNLWVAQGKTTSKLTNVATGGSRVLASSFVALGNNKDLFLMGGASVASGALQQLWVTDGTAAGTIQLTNVSYAFGQQIYGLSASNFVSIGNGEDIFTALGANGQPQLWVTNGTVAGTKVLTSVSYVSVTGGGSVPSTTSYYGLQPSSYNVQLLTSSAPTLVRQAESSVNQAVQSADLSAQYVQQAAAYQVKSEIAAITANIENAMIGSADDSAAYTAAGVTEVDWQTAFASMATTSASLQAASTAVATAQASLNALTGEFATSTDAQEAADAATEQKTTGVALGVSEAAFQSLLAAAAQAWNVSQVTLALNGQTVTAAGGNLIVAAAGTENLSDGSTPCIYAILQGANVTISNFHAGANGSRLDFLSAAVNAVLTQTATGVQIVVGTSIVTLKGVSLSALSLYDNFAGVQNAQLSGASLVANFNPGNNYIDDGMTHVLSTTFGVGGNETVNGGNGYTIYDFAKGDGTDTIVNGVAGNNAPTSELDFATGITANSLSFSKVGNNLNVRVLGTSDSVTVQGWFTSATAELNAIQAGDGARFLTVTSSELVANNATNMTSEAIFFAPSTNGIASEVENFSSPNATGTLTNVTYNWVAGGSQEDIYTGLPSGTLLEILNYTGTNGTGTLLNQTNNLTAGGSVEEWFAPSSTIATEFENFSGAYATGTVSTATYNWAAGGSQKDIYTGLPSGASLELLNYTGANATGTLNNTTYNWIAGGSEEYFYTGLPSGASLEIENFSGAYATGTVSNATYNWTAGGSQEDIYTGLPSGASLEIANFSGAYATGTVNNATYNWSAGGSEEYVYTSLPSATSLELLNFSGAYATGTLVNETSNLTSGGSIEEWFAPSSTIATEFENFSGAYATGTVSSITYNWKSGGSQQLIFTNQSGNSIETIKGYTGANSTGSVQYVQQITTPTSGKVTSSITGQGDISTLANANITFANGASATLDGTGDAVSLSNGTATTTAIVALGNDTLTGGGGYNAYQFVTGFGQDTIVNAGGNTAKGEADFLSATHNQLWFQRSGNDLLVNVLGASSSIDVSGWYSGGGAQLTKFAADDGLRIDTQVAQLVQAMATYTGAHAGFNPATASAMPTDMALQTALAASWHA